VSTIPQPITHLFPYRELDILFHRRVPARKFKSTVVDIKDNE
jgi:hypothetical protein